jgi:hypothetical protein
MPDQEHVLLELPRGETDVLRVTRKTYQDKPFTDIRVFYRADDGELRPTKKGCSVRDRELADVIAALQRVATKVASRGER